MRTLLLVLLGFALAEGLLSRCDLRRHLWKQAPQQFDDNLVAKIVCSSESMTAFNSSAFNLRTPQKGGGGAWALYGVLQLPNRLACSDDTSSAPNICRQSCKRFIDDDLDDDIKCMWTLFTELVESGFSGVHFEQLKTMSGLVFQEDCKLVEATEYFAGCSDSQG
ncbi:lysozyme C, milk isozyme-like [Nelusetta ayraudi]|uniref:lysozyme C, milk isozyme-like n=1 Tax=Nelusetta ayraudi TaxID=303726 RepID=UPI003F6F7CA7